MWAFSYSNVSPRSGLNGLVAVVAHGDVCVMQQHITSAMRLSGSGSAAAKFRIALLYSADWALF